MRTVVVGASSGLGRCIGVGLTQRSQTALLARRVERLEAAAKEAGPGTLALACDVTSTESCQSAIEAAAVHLGGIDALVYTPAIGPLASLVDTNAETWQERIFDTNVIGAATVTTAAIPHLTATNGVAVYLSSISASLTPPWQGLGAYAVSKAALDKLVEAWRAEHPSVGFTRLVVGDCVGGEGDAMTGFANDWDHDRAVAFGTQWAARKYLSDSFIEVDEIGHRGRLADPPRWQPQRAIRHGHTAHHARVDTGAHPRVNARRARQAGVRS